MPNRFNKQPEPDEPETLFTRQHETLEDSSGRFAGQTKTRIVTGGHSYPMQPTGYPLSQHPELPDPYTDKVDPADNYSDRFGLDLSGKSPSPEARASSPQATLEDPVAEASLPSPRTGSSSFLKRRF